MKKLGLLLLMFLTACGEEELIDYCNSSYPRVYQMSEESIFYIDFYHYAEGNLTFVYTRDLPPPDEPRIITLLDEERYTDTYEFFPQEYSLNGNCLEYYTNWESRTISEQCDQITAKVYSVNVNGTARGPLFECDHSDSEIIEDLVSLFIADGIAFDTVAVEGYEMILRIVD